MYDVFTELRIYPDFINGHFLQWTLNPAFNAPGPFVFSLEVSEDQNFSELIFSKALGDTYFAVDDTNLKQSASANYYYRIKLTTGDGKTYYSRNMSFDAYRNGARKYKLAANIMRNELNTQRFAGTSGYLLKRKTYGAKSSAATDPISGMIIANKAAYSTGKDGGYYPPIPIHVRSLDNEEGRELSDDGMGVKDTVGGVYRMIGFPTIQENDIIVVEPINHRFNVKKIKTAYFPGSSICVAQTLTLSQVPFTDPVYKIKTPRELQE